MRENDFRIMWKRFEIRPIITYKNGENYKSNVDFEVVKWEPTGTSCYTIAYLRWNSHEPCYELESCGMRLLDDYEEGLNIFIKSFVEWRETLYRLPNEED